MFPDRTQTQLKKESKKDRTIEHCTSAMKKSMPACKCHLIAAQSDAENNWNWDL